MMRAAGAWVIATLVALALPAQAQEQRLTAATATGVDATVHLQGMADLHPSPACSCSATLVGASARFVLVDEWFQDAIRFPLAPDDPSMGSLTGRAQRNETVVDLGTFHGRMDVVTDPDAQTLTFPGSASTIEAHLAGRYTIQEMADEVLASSHAESSLANSRTIQYYEYHSGAVLNTSTPDQAQVALRGDFSVYLWGQQWSYDDGAKAGILRTGHAVEENHGDLSKVATFVRDDHYRYAVLEVHDGELLFDQANGPLRLLSKDSNATAGGALTLHDAFGSMPVRGGRLEVDSGMVRAVGGSYRFAQEGPSKLGVDVVDPPTAFSGDNFLFVKGPAGEGRWPMGAFLAVAGAAIVLLVAGYLYPSLRGRKAMPTGSGWRSLRSDGFASMAAAAETAGWHRLAAFWMSRSLAAVPADPLRMVDLAILRAACGQNEAALGLHEAAHGWLVDAGRGDDVAHNAYEAAKAAARLGRLPQALDWMRLAIEADPGLVAQVGREPAFAHLRSHPDYASLTVGGA